MTTQDGHGTAVAFTLAGRRNDAGTHGVAFDAQIIAERADRPGSCAGQVGSDGSSPCRSTTMQDRGLGVDAGAGNGGARVINMSLGGDRRPSPCSSRRSIARRRRGIGDRDLGGQ